MTDAPGRTITDGGVVSTVLFLNKNWQAANTYRLVSDHRFMTQHQLTITSPDPITGTFSVRIIPDTADPVVEQSTDLVDLESVDIGLRLALDNSNSGILLFSGIFWGIELIKESGFAGNNTITIVLSSTRGQS